MRKVTKSDCAGCYNDVYNHGCSGAKECWSFKDAVLQRAYDVSIDHTPPYKGLKLTTRPNCYYKQRERRVLPEQLNKRGYWK